MKADQRRLQRMSLTGRSLVGEIRTVTLSGEPFGDYTPISAQQLLPAVRAIRFGDEASRYRMNLELDAYKFESVDASTGKFSWTPRSDAFLVAS